MNSRFLGHSVVIHRLQSTAIGDGDGLATSSAEPIQRPEEPLPPIEIVWICVPTLVHCREFLRKPNGPVAGKHGQVALRKRRCNHIALREPCA